MKAAYLISIAALTLIGLAHITFGIVELEQLDANGMWFLSGGIVFMLVALNNYVILSPAVLPANRYYLLQLANLLFFFFLVVLNGVLSMAVGMVALILQAWIVFAAYDQIRKKTACCSKAISTSFTGM